MSDVVIRAEGLGKKYLIGHQAAERERYTALRDVIARQARGFARSAMDMVRGRPNIAGDEIEEFWALKDVNFEIKRGDVVGIIGRNGAGKSTLLKILSRITEPSEGRVTIEGRVASLLEVGTGFHPELTGRENISLNGAILGMTRVEIRRKFDEVVDFAGVEKFLDTPVKRYSSGMYVRLAFAVAAHLEPEILVVDEVLAVGDAEFQKKCLGKMQDVAGQGRTVLFVSHNMAAVKSLCGSGVLLKQGAAEYFSIIGSAISSYLGDSQEASEFVSSKSSRSIIKRIKILDCLESESGRSLTMLLTTMSAKKIKASLDFCLRDRVGAPVGFASTGTFELLKNIYIAEGESSFKITLEFPKLALGQYCVDVFITDPFVEFLDRVNDAVTFNIEGSSGGEPQPFNQVWGYGAIQLGVSVVSHVG